MENAACKCRNVRTQKRLEHKETFEFPFPNHLHLGVSYWNLQQAVKEWLFLPRGWAQCSLMLKEMPVKHKTLNGAKRLFHI